MKKEIKTETRMLDIASERDTEREVEKEKLGKKQLDRAKKIKIQEWKQRKKKIEKFNK